jgi:DNA-binding response OmpR family regulator
MHPRPRPGRPLVQQPPNSLPIAAPPQHPRRVVRLGPLVIDPTRHTAVLGDVALSLTPTEYRLLYLLAARSDKVLSRRELAEAVWGIHDLGIDLSLAVHVRHLRAKLKHTSIPAPEIVAVRSVGYRLIWESASRDEPPSFAPSQ